MFSRKVPSELRDIIAQRMGIHRIGGFGKYLGLPEYIGRNKYDTFSFLTQKVTQRIESWYSKLLSPAGKEVLLKEVATAIPAYSMSCFLLPLKVIRQLTSAFRKFWWSTSENRQGMKWVSWSKINNGKAIGGLGIRDLRDFNIAMVAKQSWRILQEPNSLLVRVYKAKYFPKTCLLRSTTKRNASHAWRSIVEGNKLITKGARWIIGSGRNINIWHDNWLPDTLPRPAIWLGTQEPPINYVSEILESDTVKWNENMLHSMFTQEDANVIKLVGPSVTGCSDVLVWDFTKDGNYSVKSGYHLLRKLRSNLNPTNVNVYESDYKNFKDIWKMSVPPKIKLFWWKAIHNALPVAENLKRRKLIVDDTCQLCGQSSESVNHLLFQCQVTREILELAPINKPPGDLLISNSVTQNISLFFTLNKATRKEGNLFPILGWRIWKMRNDLIFHNKKWHPSVIIDKAIVDQAQWSEAARLEDTEADHIREQNRIQNVHLSHPITTIQQLLELPAHYYCFVDASWQGNDQQAGIGWILCGKNGNAIIKASSSIPPVQSSMEAEAEALRQAVLQVKRFGYSGVMFCGDAADIYAPLHSHNKKQARTIWVKSSLTAFIRDILNLHEEWTNYRYMKIPRDLNAQADELAKNARTLSLPYVINWLCN